MDYAIGLDIGGTKIEGVLVNSKGKILNSVRLPTESKKPKSVTLNNISKVIQTQLDYAKGKKIKIKGIGMGVPTAVPPNNNLGKFPNIPSLSNTNLQQYFEKKFKKKVVVANDANCFALAESMFGAGKGKNVVVGLIWGTGVGAGIVINGKVFVGANGYGGECGHAVLDPTAKVKCGCGSFGDFESLTSAPNLIKYYALYGGKEKNVDSTYIMKCKDKIAKKVADQAIDYLSRGIGFIVSLLNPEVIVLGGGISNSSHYKKINQLTTKYAAPYAKGKFKVVKHKVGDSAGVLGAAALVFSE